MALHDKERGMIHGMCQAAFEQGATLAEVTREVTKEIQKAWHDDAERRADEREAAAYRDATNERVKDIASRMAGGR